ncbi:MAG: SDR family NAD(P)-dependent oxidoreductase [Nitrospinota bacterium]
MELKGRVAVVTGAAQGIGKTLAAGLARAGADVALGDVLDAAPAAGEIAAEGAKAKGYKVDVADETSVEGFVKKVEADFGRIDVWANNAALFGSLLRDQSLEKIRVDEWDRVMAVNVRGTFLGMKAAVPALRKNGVGSIINIASDTVHKGVPGFLHYVASKGAVIGMTRAAARELGPSGIRVNAIAPGFTMSEANRRLAEDPNVAEWWKGTEARILGTRCLQRHQMPDDLVGAVVFLASDASAFMTGQTLLVNGGDVFT